MLILPVFTLLAFMSVPLLVSTIWLGILGSCEFSTVAGCVVATLLGLDSKLLLGLVSCWAGFTARGWSRWLCKPEVFAWQQITRKNQHGAEGRAQNKEMETLQPLWATCPSVWPPLTGVCPCINAWFPLCPLPPVQSRVWSAHPCTLPADTWATGQISKSLLE